jgi:predicted enzyme related to lactoylglutathione lyase
VNDVPQVGLVLDCRDPEALARFWSDALGYVIVGGVGSYVLLAPEGRPGPKLLLQRVPEDKAVKNRMHLDLEVSDIEAVADRLVQLGAGRVSPGPQAEHASRWIVLTDPEGNEFCVCDGGSDSGGSGGV